MAFLRALPLPFFNHLRTEVYFCRHNVKMMKILEVYQNPSHGTHCEALETSFQMVPYKF
jgi:hypothetical protein